MEMSDHSPVLLSLYLASHSDQFTLFIPLWVGALSIGSGDAHR